jgi:hypothetical protein
MTKKILLASLLALSTAAHADLIKVAVNGGYATIDMKDVNAVVDDFKKNDDAISRPVKRSNKFGPAFFVAGEAGISLLPFIEVGPRIEYLQATPLEYLSEGAGTFQALNVDASLTSFMLGVTTGLDLPLTGLGFQVAGYAGHGYAVAKSTYSSTTSSKTNTQYTGGGFVSELQAKLKYSLIPLLSFDLVGGMRFASVGVLSDGKNNSTQSWDFSGINAGGGLTLGF